MAVLESRPYRTAQAGSVSYSVELLEPDCHLDEIASRWRPGEPIKIAVDATVGSAFWQETGVSPGEPVVLVASTTCLSARAVWRSESRVDGSGPPTDVRTIVEIDGEVAAGEIVLECWIAGPGRIQASGGDDVVHAGAKLWQSGDALRIPLDDTRAVFPTTVLGFRRSGRPAVPWLVETVADAEPGWTVDASIRLLVNSEIPSSAAVADGSAEEHIYALIRADIRAAAIQGIARSGSQMDAAEIEVLAAAQPESFAGLCTQSAGAMGISLAHAMSLAQEDPTLLASFSRESTLFYREAGTS